MYSQFMMHGQKNIKQRNTYLRQTDPKPLSASKAYPTKGYEGPVVK